MLAFLLISDSNQAAWYCEKVAMIATTPTSRFIDNGNGTVTDAKTNLMWKRCREGMAWAVDPTFGGKDENCHGYLGTHPQEQFTWKEALLHVQNLNNTGGFAGHVNWRIPNVTELESIIEWQCSYPSINEIIFPQTVSNLYWSSSPKNDNPHSAWAVDFSEGGVGWPDKNSQEWVRLVRDK